MPRIPASTRPPSAVSLLKHITAIALFLIAAGCSGGGCSSGCSSCGGITPLADGFDPMHRIENAGSARVTQSGLTFLQSNLGTLAQGILGSGSSGGVITFPIPETTGSVSILDYDVCPGGPNPGANPPTCTAQINLGQANLQIAPAAPYDLHITGTVPVLLADLPIHGTSGCVTVFGSTVCVFDQTFTVALSGDGSCPGTAPDQIPLSVDITVHVDTDANHVARVGYTQLNIVQIVNDTDLQNNLDNALQFCNDGILSSILDLSFIKNLVIGQLEPTLKSTLSSQVDNALCQKAAAGAPCPTGTTADGSGICRFNNDPNNACATTLLGTDGHMNLGTLLASLSPGTTGGLDFVLAAGGQDPNPATSNPTIDWGDLDPANSGVTIGLFGGAEANPLSKCVPMASLTLPTGIPIPDELFQNTIPNWPSGMSGPDVEIALSERFTNYALGGVYNSGLLCIGISTESIPLLSSGTISLFAPSLKTLGLQKNAEQVAIVIRPSQPPTAVFGNGTDLTTDPNIRVDLKQVSLDFYIFSLDRFIRFMTATFDLDVPVNLTVSSAGLTPVLSTINVTNGTVTNSQLLKEMPSDLASALGSVIGSLVGQQLSGSLKAIDLNSSLASLGLQLNIPDTVDGMGSPGLVKLSKGSDNFLGIFASFGLPGMTGMKAMHGVHTHAQVVRKVVDPAGLRFETLTPDNGPVVDLMLQSSLDDGAQRVEYQYKVDTGFWHPFTASRSITVNDPWLRVQGVHKLYVRSKIAGNPYSLDETAGEVDVTIDAEAPEVSFQHLADGRVSIDVHDGVTPDPLVRWRLDDGAWSDWTLASHLSPVAAGEGGALSVETRDNEGNVGTATDAIVRGRFDGTAAGCGSCVAAGSSSRGGGQALLFLGIALAGLVGRNRKRAQAKKASRPVVSPSARRAVGGVARQAIGGAAMMAVAATWAGCSCGNNGQGLTAAGTGGTVTGVTHSSSSTSSGTGGSMSGCPNCTELQPGLIGEYTSVAVSGNTIWVAGYSEADWNMGNSYGDLVVGTWNGTKVDWKQVDGVPSTPKPDPTVYDVDGFRGGQTAPGDDVGLWTSIAIGSDGNPAVAYYDRTNFALKFAQYDGKKWAVQTVDSGMQSDVGRYAKMLFLNNAFVIAYQSIAPGGTGGALISKVRIATSASATPAAGSWTFADAVTVNTSPCRAQFCATTEACVSSTKVCTTTLDPSMCGSACSASQACVGSPAACADIWDATKVDAYPDAIGDYITIAPDGMGGFGLAYYDRTNGNLVIAASSGGTWTTTIVDGESAPTPSGDCGIGASLFIDANGNWNLVYVNGYTEALQYVQVAKGGTVGTPEIVDDGLGVAGTPFPDGQHLVGDDAHIVVDASGVVHVTYQDSTSGTLHYAVGQPGSTGHMWQVQTITQSGFAGAFSNMIVNNNQIQLVNWWRVGGQMIAGDVRIVAPM